jgi:hypothetical protein
MMEARLDFYQGVEKGPIFIVIVGSIRYSPLSHQFGMGSMRGENQEQDRVFSYISADARVPADHPMLFTREEVSG